MLLHLKLQTCFVLPVIMPAEFSIKILTYIHTYTYVCIYIPYIYPTLGLLDWNIFHWLFAKFTPTGIMSAKLRAPLKLLGTIVPGLVVFCFF